jgi:hypothetical protein
LIDVLFSQNPNATVPTLTHGGKSYRSTAEVIDYLASISSTKVAPETSITKVVHEERIDPNFALYAAVRSSAIAPVDLVSYRTCLSETTKNSSKFQAASQMSSPQLVSVGDAPIHVDDPTFLQGSAI